MIADLYHANRVTTDVDGNTYATGSAWGGTDFQHVAGFDPDGRSLFRIPINDVQGVVVVE